MVKLKFSLTLKKTKDFILNGCEMIECTSDTSGYIVTENNLNVPEFDVEVTKCDESKWIFWYTNCSSMY